MTALTRIDGPRLSQVGGTQNMITSSPLLGRVNLFCTTCAGRVARAQWPTPQQHSSSICVLGLYCRNDVRRSVLGRTSEPLSNVCFVVGMATFSRPSCPPTALFAANPARDTCGDLGNLANAKIQEPKHTLKQKRHGVPCTSEMAC